jgi:hypothetical protein
MRVSLFSAFATLGCLILLPEAEAVTTDTDTIGTQTQDVDLTAVSGTGPWTVTLAVGVDYAKIAVNDRLKDEHATLTRYDKITAIDSGNNQVTVADTEAVGAAPTVSTGQATIARWYTTMQAWETARQGDLVARNAIEKGELYKLDLHRDTDG